MHRILAAAMRHNRLDRARADRAALVLSRYAPDEDDTRAACVDLLTDLHHWADRAGLSWPALIDAANAHRRHEQPHDPRDLPLAILGPGGDFTRTI